MLFFSFIASLSSLLSSSSHHRHEPAPLSSVPTAATYRSDLAESGARRGSGGASGGEEGNLGWGVRVVSTGDGHGGGGA
jgi:hypothetical protein